MVVFLRHRGITHKKRCYNEVTMHDDSIVAHLCFFVCKKNGGQVPRNFRGRNTTARRKIRQQKYNQNYEDLDQGLEDVGDNHGILRTA